VPRPPRLLGLGERGRERSDPPFSVDDVRLLEYVSPMLGSLMRHMAAGDAAGRAAASSPPPGVMIFDRALRASSWTPQAQEWLRQLPDGARWRRHGLLPPVLYGVAGRLLADERSSGDARARVRTITGSWIVLDGGKLEGDAAGRIVITIRSATAHEVFDILCQAHELTPREDMIVRLVVGGLSTKQLAERLFITPYTVKDHLKGVFDKVGVRSRRELVGRMTGHAVDSAGQGSAGEGSVGRLPA
jgi:DNA-binding CsgD family transcriptional regulator